MSNIEVEVKYDRVGATYRAGETVTGIVLVKCPGSVQHSGITLHAEGTVALYASVRGLGAFESFYSGVKPTVMFSVTIELAKSGKLPDGDIEMPFSFDLVPFHKKQPLLETYQGVYVNSTYQAVATVNRMLGKKQSSPSILNVYCPGQSAPTKTLLEKDVGLPFLLSPDNLRSAKRFHGDTVPDFHIEGKIDRYNNDINVPLSGWVKVNKCAVRITSIELQLIRAEYAATPENAAREATEIQNIQIGDGEVMKNMQIPIYMFFPRWYTCAALRTKHLKVEFEINFVVTLEDHNQITQNLPIKLYRSA